MAFDWKSLIFVQEDKPNTSPTPAPATGASPGASPQSAGYQPTSVPGNIQADISAVYERGFESLNKDGYDFFELYKAVMAVGPDTPQAYTMAYAMGKGIKPDLSKDYLLQKGQNYLAELANVHTGYAQKGQAKLAELKQQENAENQGLLQQIQNIEKQIADLQQKLQQSKTQLEKLEGKYAAAINEMEQKIIANDQAKANLVASIEKVINGISQNI
jgi:hypothetical protein